MSYFYFELIKKKKNPTESGRTGNPNKYLNTVLVNILFVFPSEFCKQYTSDL